MGAQDISGVALILVPGYVSGVALILVPGCISGVGLLLDPDCPVHAALPEGIYSDLPAAIGRA